MALDTNTTTLLNNFADTQIALRTPKLPLGKSNPKLGDAINSAIAAAQSAATSAAQAYTAGTASNWTSTPPTTVAAALDRIAAALATLNEKP